MNDAILIFGLTLLPMMLLALTNWRYAFLAALVAGFVQDPVRKVLTTQPVAMVVFCAFVLGFALIGAIAKQGMVTLRPMSGNSARTRTLLRIFLVYVLIEAGNALFRFDSIMVPAIGVLAYLTPIPALWLAYNYVRDPADIQRFMRVYMVLGLVATVGIYLSSSGFDSVLLKPIGGEMLIFDRVAGIVASHSGFMRSSEISAWHAAAVACVAVVSMITFGGALSRIYTPAIVLFCTYGAILTGRRKVLAVMILFVAIYFLGLYYFRKRSSRRGGIVVASMTLLILIGALTMAPDVDNLSPYLLRSSTVFADAWDRLSSLGIASIGWGYDAGGFFGLGTGAGAQGTQHFAAGAAATVGGASEGGLGKITAELGIPGLLLTLVCTWLVARQVRLAISAAAKADPRLLRLSLGLLAFVAANVPVFVGASQIYGDPFVLILMGSMLGFVLAAPRVLMIRQARDAMRELRPEPARGLSVPSPVIPINRAAVIKESWGDEDESA